MDSFEMIRVGTLYFIALIVSLGVHEASHALMAYLLGDTTARDEGRLSLNPMRHLDPLGTVMMLWMSFQGVGVGWARPVPVNPLRLRWKNRGLGLVALAGPASNLVQAYIAGRILGLFPVEGAHSLVVLLGDFCFAYAMVNVGLAAFNLLPVYPLDGQKVLSALLPGYLGRRLDFFALRFGMWPLVILLLWEWFLPIPGPFGLLMGPFVRFLWTLMQIGP